MSGNYSPEVDIVLALVHEGVLANCVVTWDSGRGWGFIRLDILDSEIAVAGACMLEERDKEEEEEEEESKDPHLDGLRVKRSYVVGIECLREQIIKLLQSV